MINKKMYISTSSKLSHKFFIFAATADTEPFLLSLPPRKIKINNKVDFFFFSYLTVARV